MKNTYLKLALHKLPDKNNPDNEPIKVLGLFNCIDFDSVVEFLEETSQDENTSIEPLTVDQEAFLKLEIMKLMQVGKLISVKKEAKGSKVIFELKIREEKGE